MKINKIIQFAISVICLLSISYPALADGVERDEHNKNFVVDARKIYVKTADMVTKKMVSDKLSQNGAVITEDFFAKIIGPRVIFTPTELLKNNKKGYSIQVSKSKVAVKFTSTEMLDEALEEFNNLFSKVGSYRVIKGCDIQFTEGSVSRNNLPVNSLGLVDGITHQLDEQKIDKAITTTIKKRKQPNFILAVANRDTYRVDFNSLSGLNPTQNCLNQDWSYSTDEIKSFVNEARQQGGEFVPAIDFLSQNDRFEQYTGHKIDSPEGMRFVRAMIEECARVWGVKKICVGRESNITVAPYIIDFLESIAKREQIELIII